MRIVSLLPACTEWVVAFGRAADLVGRSHACDYPPEVEDLPVVTHAPVLGGDARCIDKRVRSTLRDGISPFVVDVDLLADLMPDIILTQTQCDVCAVSEEEIAEAASTLLHPVPRIYSVHPLRMKDVLNEALALGRLLDRSAEAMQAIGRLEKRLYVLRQRLGIKRGIRAVDMPTVVALEWIEPLMGAGHWTPDLIEMAGGRAVCTASGERSRRLDWNRLTREDPDVIAVMPCGMSLESARRDVRYLVGREGWNDLSAVRNGRVYLFDGNAYFNRPGPRLYRSIELLAAALHGDRAGVDAAPSEMVPLAS